MIDYFFWHIVATWQYWAVIAILFLISTIAKPGRIGRLACHWGLHDTHEVPGYPGRIRVACVRCTKKWETTT
jgi:hypothetical protein